MKNVSDLLSSLEQLLKNAEAQIKELDGLEDPSGRVTKLLAAYKKAEDILWDKKGRLLTVLIQMTASIGELYYLNVLRVPAGGDYIIKVNKQISGTDEYSISFRSGTYRGKQISPNRTYSVEEFITKARERTDSNVKIDNFCDDIVKAIAHYLTRVKSNTAAYVQIREKLNAALAIPDSLSSENISDQQ